MNTQGMKMMLICGDTLVNEHSKKGGKMSPRWDNPLTVLPPIGSTIEYMSYNLPPFEGEGVLTKYVVEGYSFGTEEISHGNYGKQYCKIFVSLKNS